MKHWCPPGYTALAIHELVLIYNVCKFFVKWRKNEICFWFFLNSKFQRKNRITPRVGAGATIKLLFVCLAFQLPVAPVITWTCLVMVCVVCGSWLLFFCKKCSFFSVCYLVFRNVSYCSCENTYFLCINIITMKEYTNYTYSS
jgi:hypothetical protein